VNKLITTATGGGGGGGVVAPAPTGNADWMGVVNGVVNSVQGNKPDTGGASTNIFDKLKGVFG